MSILIFYVMSMCMVLKLEMLQRIRFVPIDLGVLYRGVLDSQKISKKSSCILYRFTILAMFFNHVLKIVKAFICEGVFTLKTLGYLCQGAKN